MSHNSVNVLTPISTTELWGQSHKKLVKIQIKRMEGLEPIC